MKKSLLFALAGAALLSTVPTRSSPTSPSPLGVQDACAQTGTCKSSPGDICFVNGEPYDDREWQGGDKESYELD